MNTDGIIAIRSCVIEELVVDHSTADALLVTNSRIGRLIIRNAPLNCDITVHDSTFETLDVHSCGAVRFEGVRVADSLQVASLRGPVHLKRVRAAAISLRGQATAGRLRRPTVALEGVHVMEAVNLDDLWIASLTLQEIDAAALELRRVRVDAPFEGKEVRCREGLRINGMVVAGEANALVDSEVQGTVEVRGLRHVSTVPAQRRDPETPPSEPEMAQLVFRSSTISRLAASAENSSPMVIELSDTAVTEALALPGGPARYRLDGTSSIHEVDLGDVVFRRHDHVTGFLDRVFTRVTPGALEAVRSTLARRRRRAEEDQLYYFTRQREADTEGHRLRRLAMRALLGGILGWGVRARNPARTLAVAVFATGLVLHGTGAVRGHGANTLMSLSAMGRAMILACALWLNIGTGAPSELKTFGWTALAACCAVGGLLFTTLTVGIVIRKLVR
ncbi:hypothetical protein [Streptomyces sp. NPDC059175]|uniref:hypothetical protein n=1 Tax=unclassified Streptomyces TaxID=2593676 RepID=UPI0036B341C7